LTLRATLSDASPMSVLGFLSVALVAHVGDLAGRWEGRSRRPRTSLRARTTSGA
jgi:hypothetical protein